MLISELPREGRVWYRAKAAFLGQVRRRYRTRIEQVIDGVLTGMIEQEDAQTLFQARTREFFEGVTQSKEPWPGPTGTLPGTPLC